MEVLKKSAGYVLPSTGNRLTYLSLLLAGIFSALLFALAPTPASTLTTVPTKMNFQGRLADSAGNIKANGTYNMRLKLYTVDTGGSAVWSEDRLVSASQGVTVTNGTFSIQLGSITTLPASLFASGALYLEVELPTPATATSSSPTWTEGPMTPRNQMATSAYAYNAETLDGFDSADFLIATSNNTFTGTNLFKPTSGSTAALDVQTSASVSVLKVDTTNSIVSITNTTVSGTVTITGNTTANRPGSPSEGMIYYDTDTDKLEVYSNGKWQADRTDAVLVAASNSSQADKDAADYLADGEAVSGGGTIDGDQVQINQALTAASGKKVVLLAGTYVADATIFIPNNTTLIGVGQGSLIELANLDATDNLIENTDQTTGTGVIIRDLKIDGRKDLNTAGTQYGIHLSSMGDGTGVSARVGAKVSSVTAVNFRNYGISLNASGNGTFSNNTAFANTMSGIFMNNSDRNTVSGNIVQGNGGYGIGMTTSDYGTFSNNVIEGNTTEGFSIGSSTNNAFNGNTITGGTTGISLSAATENVFVGNVLNANTSQGFGLTLGSNNNVIQSNRVTNSGGATTNNGIYIAANSDSNSVISNYITDSSATTNNYAISLPVNTVDSTYVAQNILGTGTINDVGTGTIYANQVDASGNLINRGTNGFAVGALSASSTLTVQGGYVGQALPTPATPTGNVQGTAGTTSYSYAVTAFDGVGQTLPSTAVTITTGNATLTGANFNRITWTRVSGAVSYRVYRTASAGTPATTGLIGTVSANATFQLDDTGLAATTAVPTANTTGGISIAGGLQGSSATLTGNLIANGGIDFVGYAPFARFSSNRIALGSNGNTYSGMDFTVRNDAAITVETRAYNFERFGPTNLGGNITTQRLNVFNAPSYTGAFTLTNAATVAIGGAATTAGGAVITNNYSLWTQGGTVRMDTGAADTVGQIIRGASTQTADLLQLQNDGGTVIAKIDAAGVVQGTQLVSTVSTGTAPLTVASTTKVTNLNADSLDGIDSASFAQVATNNTWTGTNTFNVLGTNAFNIQNGSGIDVFKVDTTNQKVTVGGGPGTSTARVHIEGQASTSAMTWTARAAAEANAWSDITYGNGLFVAVAQSGTNRVMTSPDGITWTPRTAAAANIWTAVTYGNGLFVAISQSATNTVMTSRDGITWTARTVPLNNTWASITYGNGLFVTTSNEGNLMTSPDGITWTTRTAAAADQWNSVTYGNGIFVAVSLDGTVQTSPDGITWTARTAAEASAWYSVTYGNGLFVAVANTGTNLVMTSPDGITWTARTAAEANQWNSVTYGNGMFVATADTGTSRVMTSPDGITWTARTAAEANQWNSVTYGNGMFVAVSIDGTNRVMTSGDIALTTRGSVQVTGDISSTGGLSTTGNLTANGMVIFKNTANSTAAFSLQDSTGNTLLNADTANKRVTVGGGPGTSTARVHIEGQASTSAMVWTARSAAEANIWQSVTYGNGLFVAVSQDGTNRVMTSPDGITWTARAAAEANPWYSVTYGNGLYVAVAGGGTNRVMTSPDGITWTARTAAEANSWEDITYGNGLYVAVSITGTNRVMTSPDGITWTARAASEANNWNSVVYGNGLFVAVAGNGTNRVMTSPDGITWTARTAAAANVWEDITYDNGLYIAVSNNGTNRVMTSPDGITWTASTAAEANGWSSITYRNGLFVAVSYGGTNRVMTSSDIALTTRGSAQITGDLSATGSVVAGANSTNAFSIQAIGSSQALLNADTIAQKVSIGSATGSNARVHIEGHASTASMSWTARSAAEANVWQSVTYGNGLYVAVSSTGINRVMTSPDGITWTARAASEANSWQYVTYGNGLYVAVSSDGTNRVMTSPDGITWTARAASEANVWTSVTYGNGLFVAVSGFGTNRVMTSPDGITWTARAASEANNWNAVTYGNGQFIAVADNGTNRVMTSPDGITWTARSAAEANSWYDVTYGNGVFVAVSWTGTNRVMTSTNGITWTARAATAANIWQSVGYGNGLFVATSSDGTNRVMTSPDGIIWTARSAAQANSWGSVTYGNGLFVAVSYGGTNRVMTSGDIALTARGAVQVTGDIRSTGDITSSASVNATGLTITNQNSQGYVATLSNTSSATSADGLLIKLGVANASRTTGNYFVGFSDSAGTVAGKIQGGASAVAYTTTAADYAEYFKADPANMPQPGEIVALDHDTPNSVELASGEQTVMGVVSTNPGFVGNGPLCDVSDGDCDANYAKTNTLVSLVGQVPVKVTGEVKIGDKLGASEIPGVAKKITSGSYVGYALTASENGVAQVLIRPGTVNVLGTVQGGDATFTSLVTSGVATVGSLDVLGDVYVRGDIYIDGHLVSGGKSPAIDSSLVSCLENIGITGTDTAGTIQFSVNSAGCTNADLRAVFAKAYGAAPHATLTAKNRDSARLQSSLDTDTQKMTFSFEGMQSGKTYHFTYHVIQ